MWPGGGINGWRKERKEVLRMQNGHWRLEGWLDGRSKGTQVSSNQVGFWMEGWKEI